MARPVKKGLDFFPLDVTIDDNLELVEAECGLEGFAIVIKLWQKIYANGYYVDWKEENALLFSRRINSELTTVSSVINACFKRDLFNKFMYEKYSILTSKGIQSRYSRICTDAKRKDFAINPEFNLVNPELITEKPQFNQEESTQSKEEKKKEEEKKKFIPPTLLEVEKYILEKQYVVDPKFFFDYFESRDWVNSKNKPVANWKNTIVTWNNNELKKNPNAKPYKKKGIYIEGEDSPPPRRRDDY